MIVPYLGFLLIMPGLPDPNMLACEPVLLTRKKTPLWMGDICFFFG